MVFSTTAAGEFAVFSRRSPAHDRADLSDWRRAVEPGLFGATQSARLGPRAHRQLRGAVAGADRRRAQAAARGARPVLRGDREPAPRARRAADPPRTRA